MGVGVGIDPGRNINGLIPGGASILPPEITVDVWRNGLDFRGWSCHRPRRFYNSSCVPGGVAVGTAVKTFDATQSNFKFLPFPIYSMQGCDTADVRALDYRQMAELALSSGLSREFAQEITVSTYSGNPSFKSKAIPVNTTTTYSTLTPAISKLLKSRSQADVIGSSVLHVPIHLAPKLANETLVESRLDGLYLTGTSVRISLDVYPSFTPDLDTAGAANGGEIPLATETYITITGPVEYGLGEVNYAEVHGIVKDVVNHTATRVEQMGIFRFDTCGVYTALVAE